MAYEHKQAMDVTAIAAAFARRDTMTPFVNAFLAHHNLRNVMADCVRGALAAFDGEVKPAVKLHVWVPWHIELAHSLARRCRAMAPTPENLQYAAAEFSTQVVPSFISHIGNYVKLSQERSTAWREEVTRPVVPLPARETGRVLPPAPETVLTPAAPRWTVQNMLDKLNQ